MLVIWSKFHLSASKFPIDNKSALVAEMASCRQAPSHYLDQCWLIFYHLCRHLMSLDHNMLTKDAYFELELELELELIYFT